MNTWIAGKDLMKYHYQIKKLFQRIKYAHAQKVFKELKTKKPR